MSESLPQAVIGTTEFKLAHGLVARWSDEERLVEVQVAGRGVKLPLDAYRLALEFIAPMTAAEAHELVDGVSPRDFDAMIRALAAKGVLTTTDAPIADTGIEPFLRTDVFENPATVARISAALSAGHAVVIDDAIDAALAEAVHAALAGSTHWRPFEGGTREFHFKHHKLYDEAAYPEALRQAQRVFGSTATRALLTRLSGRDCSGETTFSASRYLPGDYTLPHTDNGDRRETAFVWNVSKNWHEDWGGSLYWVPTHTHVASRFNRLTLFNVSERSTHFVGQVSSHALEKRLCVNGWWRRAEGAEAREDDDVGEPAAGGEGGGVSILGAGVRLRVT